VWTHTLTPEGNSEGLASRLEVACGDSTKAFDLGASGGQAMMPLDAMPCEVQITL
jgi:hypothetical protein